MLLSLWLKVSYKGEHQLKVVSIVSSLHLRDLYIKECLLPECPSDFNGSDIKEIWHFFSLSDAVSFFSLTLSSCLFALPIFSINLSLLRSMAFHVKMGPSVGKNPRILRLLGTSMLNPVLVNLKVRYCNTLQSDPSTLQDSSLFKSRWDFGPLF